MSINRVHCTYFAPSDDANCTGDWKNLKDYREK